MKPSLRRAAKPPAQGGVDSVRFLVKRETTALAAITALAVVIGGFAPAAVASSNDGGASASYFPLPSGGLPDPGLGPQPGRAVTSSDGLRAVAPANSPLAVAQAIRAANRIAGKPYRWGGGHRRFVDSAYDCSGAVSFALHGAGLVPSPLDSRALVRWGQPGLGTWVTVYANSGHAFVMIAGLRFDTSGPGASGPRWRPAPRSVAGFIARHFPGL
jgi:cell wall-associated NlpC family hydrolase